MSQTKIDLVKFGLKIARARLVAGAGGNISARNGEIVWMKPSGFAMDEMDPDDLCGMDLASGRQVAGKNKPTSEVNMHLGIYRVRPDVKAIFHTHSPWASGVITSGIKLRPLFAEFAEVLGRTATVPYVTPTTQALADAMAGCAKTHDTIFMVNHGVLAVGADMKQAYYRVVIVEDVAISYVAARVTGKPRVLKPQQVKYFMNLNGK